MTFSKIKNEINQYEDYRRHKLYYYANDYWNYTDVINIILVLFYLSINLIQNFYKNQSYDNMS
jgi:hypothetical protein